MVKVICPTALAYLLAVAGTIKADRKSQRCGQQAQRHTFMIGKKSYNRLRMKQRILSELSTADWQITRFLSVYWLFYRSFVQVVF
jgi:hypothetical protein